MLLEAGAAAAGMVGAAAKVAVTRVEEATAVATVEATAVAARVVARAVEEMVGRPSLPCSLLVSRQTPQ